MSARILLLNIRRAKRRKDYGGKKELPTIDELGYPVEMKTQPYLSLEN